MSSGQHPRTPRHFPRMKVRGARRRRDAPWQMIARQYDLFGEACIRVGEQVMRVGRVVSIPMEAWATWSERETDGSE